MAGISFVRSDSVDYNSHVDVNSLIDSSLLRDSLFASFSTHFLLVDKHVNYFAQMSFPIYLAFRAPLRFGRASFYTYLYFAPRSEDATRRDSRARRNAFVCFPFFVDSQKMHSPRSFSLKFAFYCIGAVTRRVCRRAHT